jgi:hypothetical protein
MRFDTTVDVKSDGKADISMLYAAMTMEEEPDTSEMDEAMNQIRESGWECELYNQDGYLGFKCTKRGVDLEKIAEELESTSDTTGMAQDGLVVTKDGNNYTIDWKVMGDDSSSEMEEYKQYFSQYGGYLKIVFKLPNKAKNHNATTVEDGGKTLTWDLLEMQSGENLHVEFSLSMLGTIIMWALIALAVIALIIIAIIIIKKVNANKAAAPAGPAPGADGDQPGFDPGQYGQQAFDQTQQYGQQGYDQAQQYGQQGYDQAQQYAQQGYDQAYDQAQQYTDQAYDQAQQYAQQQPYDPTNNQ